MAEKRDDKYVWDEELKWMHTVDLPFGDEDDIPDEEIMHFELDQKNGFEKEFFDWCKENLTGPWLAGYAGVWFGNADDKTLFILKWVDGNS